MRAFERIFDTIVGLLSILAPLALVAWYILNSNKTNENSVINEVKATTEEVQKTSVSEKTNDYNYIDFSEDQGKLLYLLVEDDISKYVNDQNSDTAYGRKKPSIIRVSANKLFSEYSKNEIKADDLYRDKQLIVTGTIASIDRSVGESYYLSLATDEMFHTVHANFDKKYKATLAKLYKGQKYKMICIGDGMLMRFPNLRECKPIDNEWIDSEIENIVWDCRNYINKFTKFSDFYKDGLQDNSSNEFCAVLVFMILSLPDISISKIIKNNKLNDKIFQQERTILEQVFEKIGKEKDGNLLDITVKEVLELIREEAEKIVENKNVKAKK